MYGGIVSQVGNTTNQAAQTASTNALFRIVLVPTSRHRVDGDRPTITVTHGSSASINLQSLDPPRADRSTTASPSPTRREPQTQYGLTLQDGYFNYRGQDEKYS